MRAALALLLLACGPHYPRHVTLDGCPCVITANDHYTDAIRCSGAEAAGLVDRGWMP